MTYGIYVQPAHTRIGCYLGEQGLVAWRDGARTFASLEDVAAEIARRGWVNSTSVQPCMTTAYACEIY